jgi:hypothetical protein
MYRKVVTFIFTRFQLYIAIQVQWTLLVNLPSVLYEPWQQSIRVYSIRKPTHLHLDEKTQGLRLSFETRNEFCFGSHGFDCG